MPVGITVVGGAVLQSSLVVRERETVTDLGTEESMTVTAAAELDWFVGVTTARSSEPTTTRRMTAVRDPLEVEVGTEDPQTGARGRAGGVWLPGLSGGSRSAGVVSVPSTTGGSARSTPRRGTPTPSARATPTGSTLRQ